MLFGQMLIVSASMAFRMRSEDISFICASLLVKF